MSVKITTSACNSDGTPAQDRVVIVDHIPNECPICRVTIEPVQTGEPLARDNEWLEVYFRCSNRKCKHLIIAKYLPDFGISQAGAGAYYFKFIGTLPYRPVERKFSESMTDTSPLFATIYNRASAAEEYKLPDVAGPGYRKALEFLLKDYAIKLNPNDAATIRTMQLANVISTYFKDPRMAVVFSRATWLGNDQTHYERRWVDHDIGNLKTLINASVHFIEMEALASSLPTEMPDPKQVK